MNRKGSLIVSKTQKDHNKLLATINQIPLSTKKKFLKELTEDDFRDRVVRPLFILMGMEFAKDVCGTDEQGKDCYFWEEHTIAGRTATVVQTKRGNLSLSSKSKENAVIAATQIKTALETKISDPAIGAQIFPSKAFLVTSGLINTSARDYICQNVSDGRLSFLDAENIIPWIDDKMPEFWNGIDADKLPYLKNLRSELLEKTESIDVSEIGINAGTPSPISDDAFAQIYLHQLKPKVIKVKGRTYDDLKIEEIKVQDLLEKKTSRYS